MMKKGPARRFDWDDARRRHAAGESYTSIARDVGVTINAVIFACDARGRNRSALLNAERQSRGVCSECGKRCSTNPAQQDWPRCRACFAKSQVTTVRDDALRCGICREWKWDTEFAWSRYRSEHRRGRHKTCRACSTIVRQQAREKRKIPCVQCGAPCLPASEKGAHGKDTRLCLTCYRASRRPRLKAAA